MEWALNLVLHFWESFFVQDVSLFESQFVESFSSCEKIIEIYPELSTEKMITRPPGTMLDLFFYESGTHQFCVSYKTPYQNNDGVLSLWEGDCEDKKILKSQIKNIKKLEVDYDTHDKKIQFKSEKFTIGAWGGKNIYFENFLPKKIGSIGKDIDARYRDGKITFCHRVDESCKEIIPNECNLCAYGFYEVVDYSCPNIGGSKICGPNRCGERGEPACVRGLQHGNPPFDIWGDESSAGFCQKGLTTICDENKILICK